MFSENPKTLRRQKGFIQEKLAARLNVVRQTVSKWETGAFPQLRIHLQHPKPTLTNTLPKKKSE